MREVVARTPPPPRWLGVLAAVQLVNLVYWTVRLFGGERDAAVVMVVSVAVALAAATAALVASRRATLVLTPDHLLLERRRHPLTIARQDVRGVRGDVPGRPSWSEVVLLDVGGREVRLPVLDARPATLVPRLQRWADVGERAAHEPGAGEATPA
ncbi:hypothetical protein AB6N23_04720 [Cellulomonas sp. 179-A 9B4 NHS]|uniref:hypothetical protein n=1 Tax=Cellulomonas sp. 179-A 9B4 NHS TaxID=3142379 RepID=UPI0039A01ADF